MAEAQYGKTAPRLSLDLRAHNPAAYITLRTAGSTTAWGKQPEDAPNLLTRLPVGYETGHATSLPTLPSAACRHSWSAKLNQTKIPAQNEKVERGETYLYSAVCLNCRWHLRVKAWRQDPATSIHGEPCPKEGFALHRLVLKDHSLTTDKVLDEGAERYTFVCSGCPLVYEAYYFPPRLTDAWINLLISPHNLQHRCEDFKRTDPERADPKPEKAIAVLEALSAYIRDGLSASDKQKRIPRANRRFVLSFGTDCTDFLKWLGFGQDGDQWVLPNPPPTDPAGPYGQRLLLEDAREELIARLRQYPDHERQALRNISQADWAINSDPAPLNHLLGYDTYDSISSLRRTGRRSDEEEKAVEALGCLSDFGDRLLIWAFNLQVINDPLHRTFYWDSLLVLQQFRESDDLDLEVANLASQGYHGSRDIENAYRYLALDPSRASSIGDDEILGNFESRLTDTSAGLEAELRQQLRILGEARGSYKLKDAASNDFQTYEQALRWLVPEGQPVGDPNSFPDEAIVTLAELKAAEHSSPKVEKAVQLIQKHRDSSYLALWLQRFGSGADDSGEEELVTAYQFYQIKDRNEPVDLEALMINKNVIINDDPTKAEIATKHYDTIVKHQERGGSKTISSPDYSKPVGLRNMGTTCYLNCLLQYFYTVTPVRDIILNFDQHKLAIPTGSKPTDYLLTVQNDRVSCGRVEQAQKFPEELRLLFDGMAHDPGPISEPTWDLADLALVNTADSPTRRKSTLSGGQPSFGPQAKPTDDTQTSVKGGESMLTDLGEAPLTPVTPDKFKPVVASPSPIEDLAVAQNAVPGSKSPNEQGDVEMQDAAPDDMPALVRSDSGLGDEPAVDPQMEGPPPAEPKRPPPIPPRSKGPESKANVRKKAEEAAMQQDVTEVYDKILFKIMCSIDPSIGSDVNQTDSIYRLFHTAIKYHWGDGREDTSDAFNYIAISAASQPEDIHAGLDAVFEQESVSSDGKMVNRYPYITRPPAFFSVNIHRSEFNRADGQTYMNPHIVAINETIYLDRYMQGSDRSRMETQQRKRAHLIDLRAIEKKALVKRLELDPSALVDAMARYIDNLNADPEDAQIGMDPPEIVDAAARESDDVDAVPEGTPLDPDHLKDFPTDQLKVLSASLKRKSEEYAKHISALEADIAAQKKSMSGQFDDLTKYPFRIAAVFVHRGTTKSGHYWIYIHDFAAGIWRKYEDQNVTIVPDSEVFDLKEPATTGAPYFVIYVDANRIDLVDPLRRIPRDPVAADAVMDESQTVIADSSQTIVAGSSQTVQASGARTAKEQVFMDLGYTAEDIQSVDSKEDMEEVDDAA